MAQSNDRQNRKSANGRSKAPPIGGSKTAGADKSKRRPGLRPAAAAVGRVANPIFKKRGFAEARIVTDWSAIVGEDLANRCCPEKLVFDRRQSEGPGAGALHIRVEGAFAAELQHLTPQVIERVNRFFGYRAVDKIRLVQGPLPPPEERPTALPPLEGADRAAIEAAVRAHPDGPLRTALERLGAALHRRARKGQ